MADQTISFILEAVDNASDKIAGVGESLEGLSNSSKLALIGIGAAATAALGASVMAAENEAHAINIAAQATADAAGGYDKAKAALITLNAEMEKQGFTTEQTTEAFTALVTKAGMDVPTALAKTADLLAYSELPNNSLQKSIRNLSKAESDIAEKMEGSAKKRIENADLTLRMAIANEKFGNIMERVGQKLIPVVEAALEFASKLMDGFEQLDPVLQDIAIVVGIIAAAIASLVGLVVALASALGPVVAIFGGWSAVLAPIATALGGIVAFIASMLTGVGEVILIIAAIVAALAIFKAAWDSNFLGIRDLLTPFVDWLTSTFSHIENILLIPLLPLLALKLAWDNNFLGMTDTITGFINTITSAIQGFIDNVVLKWAAWLAGLVLGIVDFGVKVIAEVNKFVTGITKAFEDLIKKGLEWGAQLVSNVLQGISDKAKEIGDAVGSAASSAWDILSGGTTGASGLASSGVTPLATGGIITQPTMALLGEGGENEYVIPEHLLRGLGGNITLAPTIIVQGDVNESNRDFVISTVQTEMATLLRSVAR
jgi:hypothetical protein